MKLSGRKKPTIRRISTPGNEEEASGRTTSPRQQPAYRKKESMQGRKPLVKWPKSNSKEWETINTDLSLILSNIKGSAEKKLEKMGDLIYSYGEEKCGMKEQVRKKDMLPTPKSRRLQEIQQLVKERRRLRKLWRKATVEEREGINFLQEDLKHRLSKLRRAESLRMRRKKKEKARTDFYKDPFKFVKGIFTKEKSGFLKTSKDQVEEHLRTIYTDEKKDEPIVVPTDIPPVSPPQHQFDISPPKLSEVKQAVKKARSASAPGPNGVPYSVYKNAPDVLKILWKNMKVAWDKQIIPKAWRRAGGVFIPKEKNSTTIEQFRQINLLNIEGKIFFSVLAQRLTQYLKQNHFIDTSIQKAGIAGFRDALNITASYGIKSRLQRKKGKSSTSCSSIWPMPMVQSLIHFCGLPLFLPGADYNNKSSETLLPGSTVLPYNIRLHHKLATARSRHHGGVHHLPIGLHDGNGDHY